MAGQVYQRASSMDMYVRISHIRSYHEDFLGQQYKQLPKPTGDRGASQSVWELLYLCISDP